MDAKWFLIFLNINFIDFLMHIISINQILTSRQFLNQKFVQRTKQYFTLFVQLMSISTVVLVQMIRLANPGLIIT